MTVHPPSEIPEGVPLLTVDKVRKAYGNAVVLRELSLTVQRHQCVALIGASGSGKSTLLRCINLLEIVDDGTITLDGVDITDPRVDPDVVRSTVGIVFQSFNLFPHMSVLDNITLAPRKVHGAPRATAESRAREMLEQVGPDRGNGPKGTHRRLEGDREQDQHDRRHDADPKRRLGQRTIVVVE